MKKGFMKMSDDPQYILESIGALNGAGVGTCSIRLGDDFAETIEGLCPGDTLVVNRLEEISDSVIRLAGYVSAILARGAFLHVLDSPWVAAYPVESRLSVLGVKGSSGGAGKGSGRGPGRPPGDNMQLMTRCLDLYRDSQISVRQICEELGCSERTIYRYLRKSRQNDPGFSVLPYRPRGRKTTGREGGLAQV